VGKQALLYAGTVVVFFAIDLVWLNLVAKDFYRERIGGLLLDQFNLPVALGFYLLYIVGIIVFAVLPGIQAGSVLEALWRGALFGLVAYGTYDLTNLSTLKDWSPVLTVVDMVWGTVLTGAVASAGWWLAGLLGMRA